MSTNVTSTVVFTDTNVYQATYCGPRGKRTLQILGTSLATAAATATAYLHDKYGPDCAEVTAVRLVACLTHDGVIDTDAGYYVAVRTTDLS